MADINTIKNTLLNQLASEIIVLDKDLNLVWMNDSATSNGWIFNNTKTSLITDQLGGKTSIELTKLLIDCTTSGASVTKRGF
ncbi:histidine kinase, partial [Gammaproteobacteria bacterium]|nr:histidine kinase [Gammaproteobacteria bacterium]